MTSQPFSIFLIKNILNKTKRTKKLAILRDDTFKALSIIGVKKSNIFIGDFDDNELDKQTLLKLKQSTN